MSTYAYHQILQQVQRLSPDEQLQLLADLATMLRHHQGAMTQHSITELEGLGKEIWQGVNVDEYIRQERASWDG